jgi:excisionase family DNA binding protein
MRSAALLAVALDRHAAIHLVAALRNHRAWTRERGYAFPPALDALEQAALRALETSGPDSGRQWPTANGRDPQAATTVGPMVITVDQAASALGVSTRTVERMIASGELFSTKVGGSRRIPVSELQRLAGTTTIAKEGTP